MQTPTQYPVINWNKAAAKSSLFENLEFFSLASTPHEEECTPAGYEEVNNKSQITSGFYFSSITDIKLRIHPDHKHLIVNFFDFVADSETPTHSHHQLQLIKYQSKDLVQSP